jgi:hypothetical protein
MVIVYPKRNILVKEYSLETDTWRLRNQVGESGTAGLVKEGSRFSRGAAPSMLRSSSSTAFANLATDGLQILAVRMTESDS